MVTESNPGPTQNNCKSPRGQSKRIKVFKGTPNKCDLCEKIIFNVVSSPKVQNAFSNAVQPVTLNIIKPWSVICHDTTEPLQKMKFEVNYDINSNVSLCQGDITKINGLMLMIRLMLMP